MNSLKDKLTKAGKDIKRSADNLDLKEKAEQLSDKVKGTVNAFDLEKGLKDIGSQLGITKEARLGELRLDSRQFGQLFSLVEGEQSEDSPLDKSLKRQELSFDLAADLQSKGWLAVEEGSKQPKLMPAAAQALQALLAPTTSAQVLLGSPKELAITQLYSSRGFADKALVLYTRLPDEDLHIIRAELSPADLSDALLAQLLNGPHLEGLDFELDLDNTELLALLSVLDLVYTRRLQAKLDNENFPVLSFNAAQVQERFEEIRLGEDLLWLSALVPYMFPYVENSLPEKQLAAVLNRLAEQKLLTPMKKKAYQPSDFCQSLSESLLPMVSFGSLAVVGEDAAGLHLGFVIGLNANLVISIDSARGKRPFRLSGMDGVQLSRLIYELGLSKNSVQDSEEE
jgi:hypothetical protein